MGEKGAVVSAPMKNGRGAVWKALLWETPGWAFLLSGIVILSAVLLVPVMVENRRLVREREKWWGVLGELRRCEERYAELIRAVEEQDPMVLGRLAFHQLNLKPTGRQMIFAQRWTEKGTIVEVVAERPEELGKWLKVRGEGELEARPREKRGVERWLGEDGWRWLERVKEVVMGTSRVVMSLVGGGCLVLGLVPWRELIERKGKSGRADQGEEEASAEVMS